MWIKTDYEGTLEDLKAEVENALIKFEEDKKAGTLVPVSDDDKDSWL
jgi:hypothetical protein